MALASRKFLRALITRLARPIGQWYISKPRKDKYEGVNIDIPVGVFHSGMFFSTRLMLNHLHKYSLSNQRLLEIGAGSGMVAIWCAKQGAMVTATDISSLAIAAIRHNATQNGVQMTVLKSDLFEDLPEQRFDFVVINPPYYPANPVTEAQHAWYCGAGFEYFVRLFEGLHRYRKPDSQVLMVLSEDCDMERIRTIAQRSHWDMEMIHPDRKWGEWSFIYSLHYKRVG